jgi:hypothetical protein
MISKIRMLLLSLAMAAAGGCATSTEVLALRCDVYVNDIQPQPAKVGESVQLVGTPFTSGYDSAVYIDGERARVLDVDRSTCVTCDACRAQAGCTECSDCDVCDQICTNTCTETITFEVPDLEAGDHSLQLFNAHGQTEVLDFSVESSGFEESDSSDDSGANDTGAGDTATSSDSGT